MNFVEHKLTNAQIAEHIDWDIGQLSLIHPANVQFADPCRLEDHLRKEETTDKVRVRRKGIVVLEGRAK